MNPVPIKPLISTSDLDKIDVRVGTILAVTEKSLFAKRVRIALGGLQTEVTRPPQLTKLLLPNSR